MKLEHVYLDQTGLALFLGGQTSVAVMRVLWHKPMTIKHIMLTLRSDDPAYKNAAYTTLATTCERLTERGILYRTNIGTTRKPLFLYTPVLNEMEFVLDCFTQLFDALHASFPKVMQEVLE